MYCSTCGALVPPNRSSCDTCGSVIRRVDAISAGRAAGDSVPGDGAVSVSSSLRTCPRCDYRGQGLPYFSRGSHVAGLVLATFFTLPWALGAGGIVYYGLRRDHRICPRCGAGWGVRGERAADVVRTRAPTDQPLTLAAPAGGLVGAWSVILFALGAVLLTVGALELEVVALAMGGLAAAGGVVLHRAARKARAERRVALIAALQLPVLKLAAERSGRLTVTEVAASLGWPLRRAEKVLHSLDDGWRVSSEVTDEGVIVYEFRELMLGSGGPPE